MPVDTHDDVSCTIIEILKATSSFLLVVFASRFMKTWLVNTSAPAVATIDVLALLALVSDP